MLKSNLIFCESEECIITQLLKKLPLYRCNLSSLNWQCQQSLADTRLFCRLLADTDTQVLPQVAEAMQGFQYDVVIDDIIDEVMEPQLRPVIIEAWRDVVDVDRNKQVKKVRFS